MIYSGFFIALFYPSVTSMSYRGASSWYLGSPVSKVSLPKEQSGRWSDPGERAWCGVDELHFAWPQRFFKARDTNGVFSLSLSVSFIRNDQILLLSGALNSVSREWPECLFRTTRCRSHQGDRTLQVAQLSRAIWLHEEAICIPWSIVLLHTQLRFTEGVMGRPTRRFWALGDWACVTCICSLYQFLRKDAVSTQAGRNHLGRKSQALGRGVLCPLGPWLKSKVQGNVLANILSALTDLPLPMLLSRNIVNAID